MCVCVCVCVWVYHIYQSRFVSIYLSIYVSVFLSIYLSIYLCSYPSTYLFISLSLCLSINWYIAQSIFFKSLCKHAEKIWENNIENTNRQNILNRCKKHIFSSTSLHKNKWNIPVLTTKVIKPKKTTLINTTHTHKWIVNCLTDSSRGNNLGGRADIITIIALPKEILSYFLILWRKRTNMCTHTQ